MLAMCFVICSWVFSSSFLFFQFIIFFVCSGCVCVFSVLTTTAKAPTPWRYKIKALGYCCNFIFAFVFALLWYGDLQKSCIFGVFSRTVRVRKHEQHWFSHLERYLIDKEVENNTGVIQPCSKQHRNTTESNITWSPVCRAAGYIHRWDS